MPTPSPSIVASTGVIVLKLVTAAASVSSDSPRPTDTSASTIGSPAATTLPSMISRMMMAAIRPRSSLVPVAGGSEFWITGPVNCSSTPEPATAASVVSLSWSTSSLGTSNDCSENCTST